MAESTPGKRFALRPRLCAGGARGAGETILKNMVFRKKVQAGNEKNESVLVRYLLKTIINVVPAACLAQFLLSNDVPKFTKVSQPVHTALRAVGASRRDSVAQLCEFRNCAVLFLIFGKFKILISEKEMKNCWRPVSWAPRRWSVVQRRGSHAGCSAGVGIGGRTSNSPKSGRLP